MRPTLCCSIAVTPPKARPLPTISPKKTQPNQILKSLFAMRCTTTQWPSGITNSILAWTKCGKPSVIKLPLAGCKYQEPCGNPLRNRRFCDPGNPVLGSPGDLQGL